MSIVADLTDPSGQGMFSKAGRYTSEKHLILQKRQEILNDERKFVKLTSLTRMKFNQDENNGQRQEDINHTEPAEPPQVKQRPQISIMDRTQSREQLSKILNGKPNAPAVGTYNPRFGHIEKKVGAFFNYTIDKSHRTDFVKTANNFNTHSVMELDHEPIPFKHLRKVVTPTSLDKQIGREKFLSPGNNPHEERFNFLEIPSVSTKSRKMVSPNLSKTLSREKNAFYANKEYQPTYAPNFDSIRKNVSNGVNFKKMSKRKPLNILAMNSSDALCDPETFFRATGQSAFSPSFDKYLPRDYDSSTPLPSFMQKSVHTRLSIGTLSQKMLEINNFCDGRFQTVYSSINIKKKKNIFKN